MSGPRIPLATYRLQLNSAFRLGDALDLVPYLHALGISDLYVSPIQRARAGSTHGYDVTHPLQLNPELGSEEDLRSLSGVLGRRGMGLLLDIVPNHMAASVQSEWWMDVLEHGQASPYAAVFDIDWSPASPTGALGQQILLPILGDRFGAALERKEFALVLEEDGFAITYFERKFPVDPSTWEMILAEPLQALRAAVGPGHPQVAALADLLEETRSIPPRGANGSGAPEERRSRCADCRSALSSLLASHPGLRARLEEGVEKINGGLGGSGSLDRLEQILRAQAYRLAHWRLGSEMTSYRRFFDIGGLVGVRVEDPEVFHLTHGLVLRLAREGIVTGLRIDHIDGLFDPTGYLERLQASLGSPAGEPGFYVVVEKILSGEERLPPAWPVHGTTGYEFMNALAGLFVDRRGLDALDGIYTRFTGEVGRFADILYEQKKMVIADLFAGEMRYNAAELCRLAADDRHGRDLPAPELERALVEVTACLPVYRTYVRDTRVSAPDRAAIEAAVAEARRRGAPVDGEAYAFLERVLLMEAPPHLTEEQRRAWVPFVMRWQQHTGPVCAKGLEDTALYQYNRLISLNVIGGNPDPDRSKITVEAFHDHNRAQVESQPLGLIATSTHDSKRSEDVRARLHVLSEMPETWARALRRWTRWNQPHLGTVEEVKVPHPDEAMLIYQTLLGAWPNDPADLPSFRERLKGYVVKAAREAKRYTSWLKPNLAHEEALLSFVDSVLDESRSRTFLADFEGLRSRVAYFGALNSLSQLVAKIASPGVPDFYQGNELWTYTLVDPDNRRPVDFAPRRQVLSDLQLAERGEARSLVREMLASWTDGRIKMWVMWRGLRLRQKFPELFTSGEYIPLRIEGPRADHVCAFARRRGDDWALCTLAVRVARLTPPGSPPLGRRCWKSTEILLPDGSPAAWRDTLGGSLVKANREGRIAVRDLFAALPFALLERL